MFAAHTMKCSKHNIREGISLIDVSVSQSDVRDGPQPRPVGTELASAVLQRPRAWHEDPRPLQLQDALGVHRELCAPLLLCLLSSCFDDAAHCAAASQLCSCSHRMHATRLFVRPSDVDEDHGIELYKTVLTSLQELGSFENIIQVRPERVVQLPSVPHRPRSSPSCPSCIVNDYIWCSRRRDCHSAAPPSTFNRCFHSDGKRASAK